MNPYGDLGKDAEMNDLESNVMDDSSLEKVTGGVKASDKKNNGKFLDVAEAVIDCADVKSPVGKAGLKGLRTVIKAMKDNT